MQEEEITSTDSLRHLNTQMPDSNFNVSQDKDPVERSTITKSSQRKRNVIPRSKISPPIKLQEQIVTLFSAQSQQKENFNNNNNDSAQRQNKHFEVVLDVPTTLKSAKGDFEKKVIEMGSQKFKVNGSTHSSLNQMSNGLVRIQQIKVNMKIAKDCLIDLELQSFTNSAVKKRFLLSTNNANLNDLDSFQNQENIYESISSSQDNSVKPQVKPQSIYKIGLDGTKLRSKWQIICIDFDKLMPAEITGQKYKLNYLSIQAPQARLFDIQIVFVSLERSTNKSIIASRKLQVSSSTQNINKLQEQQQKMPSEQQLQPEGQVMRQRKAYVNQEETKDGAFKTKKRSVNQPTINPKSYSVNSRQELIETSKTPQNAKELPPLINKNLKQELKVIHERINNNDQQQSNMVQKRQQAKSAVVSSQKFKKSSDDTQGGTELSDTKGLKFIQKLTERQKRMEERYFKKDGNNKQAPAQEKKTAQISKANQKMINTNGFKETSNVQFFGMNPNTQIDFKKSCTFSSTLRNFQYNGQNVERDENEVDESIQEEICQSQREGDQNQMIPGMKQQVQINKDKPPMYQIMQNNQNSKGIKLVSRESLLTGGTLGMGAQSTRSTSIKTPLMFGGSRQKSSNEQTQYSQASGAKFSSATETKQDYYKYCKDENSSRGKLIFSPNLQNDGGNSDNELILGKNQLTNDLQRYTQTVFEQDNQYEETEEDGSLYVVDAAIEYKADYGLQRRPFSPPFKIL